MTDVNWIKSTEAMPAQRMTPDQLTEIFRHYKPPFRYEFPSIEDDEDSAVISIKVSDFNTPRESFDLFGQWVADTLNEKWEQMKMTPVKIDTLAEEIWNRHGWEYEYCDKKTAFIWGLKLGMNQEKIKNLMK